MAKNKDYTSPKDSDLSPSALVRRALILDNQLHYLTAKRAAGGKRTKKDKALDAALFRDWTRVWNKLMKLAGTKKALKLVDCYKD